nr:cytochrome P450 [Halomonas sp.]
MTQKLVLMIEGGAAIGPQHWASRRARNSVENELIGMVNAYRGALHEVDHSSPFAIFANACDDHGDRLESRVVAVELINIIRPIVAIARYMVFAVLAMHQYPSCLEKLKQSGPGPYRFHFIQEVRRYYPFFPFLAARVKTDFTWNGYRFHRGRQTILDLYGTNHDTHRWESPHQFWPERFEQECDDSFRFAMIPQGGSDQATQHRCPGEDITLALIDLAVNQFTRQLSYDVPDQDLTVDLNVIPARPRSGLVISNIRPLDPVMLTEE